MDSRAPRRYIRLDIATKRAWKRVMRLILKQFMAVVGAIGIAYVALNPAVRAENPKSVTAGQTHRNAEKPVIIFAAASLKTALDEALATWGPHSLIKTAVSYAGSNTLARQIEHGAPADVFISADLDWMNWLAARKLARNDDIVLMLRNQLVLVAPASQAAPLDLAQSGSLPRRMGNGRLAMAETGGVPAGRYGKAALETLGLWRDVSTRLAQADNVRSALQFVARGEAPLGLVYASDAISEPRVAVVAKIPASTHPPIVYPAAVLVGSRHPQAHELLAYLASAEARRVFEKHGFLTPGKPGT